MTAVELAFLLNNKYSLNDWPRVFNVSPETYANVCQTIFTSKFQDFDEPIPIFVGKVENGIMFKNIELILMESGYVEK